MKNESKPEKTKPVKNNWFIRACYSEGNVDDIDLIKLDYGKVPLRIHKPTNYSGIAGYDKKRKKEKGPWGDEIFTPEDY